MSSLTDISAGDVSAGVKIDSDELPESGGVVVLDGLGVPEGLQDGVGLQQLLLKLTLTTKNHKKSYFII